MGRYIRHDSTEKDKCYNEFCVADTTREYFQVVARFSSPFATCCLATEKYLFIFEEGLAVSVAKRCSSVLSSSPWKLEHPAPGQGFRNDPKGATRSEVEVAAKKVLMCSVT